MGLTKAQLKRKALNRIASQAAAEKRRRKARGDQLDNEQQGSGDDAQQAAAAAATGREDEQQQLPDERHLHELADVAAAAAAGVDAAGQEGMGGGGFGLQAHDEVAQEVAAAPAAVAVATKPAAVAGQLLGGFAGGNAGWHAAGDELLLDDAAGWQQHDSFVEENQELTQRQQQQGHMRQHGSRPQLAASDCCDWATSELRMRITTQGMDSWHNEGVVLPQFQLDYYSALLGMPTISYATDWLQRHAAEGSSVEKMGADLLSWLLPTLTPEKSCEGYEQLVTDTAATLHALLQTPASQVLLQASARAYSALATALQQAQQQTQQLTATQQVLQSDQQGVPLLDARRQGSSSQEVADWLRQQQAQGRLAAAVLMPQHSCAAGLQFAERALNAHMQVAFPGLGAGGFEEPVMMRGTGFAMLNLLLELAVARWASVARDSIAALSSLPPLGSAEGYAALSAAVRATLVGSMSADACVARAEEAAKQAAQKAAAAQAAKPSSAAGKKAADAAAALAATAKQHAEQAEQCAERLGVSKDAVAAAGKAAAAAAASAAAAAAAAAAAGSGPSRACGQQQHGAAAQGPVVRVPYIYNANPCDRGTADDSLVAAYDALGLLTHYTAASGSKLKTGFTWLTPSPAAEQAAAAAAAAAHSSCALPGRLLPVYGCHATNISAQLDLDAAVQTLATVPTADACLVQLRDDGLGRAVRAFGRAGPRPVAEHRLLEVNLFGILLPVMIISACLTTTRWHIEDLALGAMNCMAWGAPKLWLLATTRGAAERLLALLAARLGGEQQAQQQLLHKQLLFHDISLQEALGCGLVPYVQQPGTAVFTLPGVHSLHVTVSSGFSVAVSGNNFFSSSSSLQQHIAGLEDGPLGSLLFPAAPAEGGWDQGHAEARQRVAPLLAKLGEAQHSTAS